MPSILLWLIVILMFLVGLAGIVIPFLPGIALIFGGVLVYAVATGFATISKSTLIIIGILTLIAWLADYYGGAVAARLGGGGKWAAAGSILGLICGLIIAGPVGLFVGAFIGALLGALYEGKDTQRAGTIALLSVVGTLGATVVQLLLGIAIILAFFLALAIG